jgi:hypothetical protein
VTIQDVIVQYEGRIRELQTSAAQVRFPDALAACALTAALALLLALSLYAIRGQMSFLWASLPIPVAAASVRRLRQTRQSKSRMWRLKRFYERAVQRVNGNWAHSGITGDEFSEPDHVYSADLNVIGEGSLFEMLCIARTSIGRRGLANYLLHTPPIEEAICAEERIFGNEWQRSASSSFWNRARVHSTNGWTLPGRPSRVCYPSSRQLRRRYWLAS